MKTPSKLPPLTLSSGVTYCTLADGSRQCTGSQMGRATLLPDLAGPMRLRLVRVRIDSGGYDSGGAYWGIGSPLYRAVSLDSVPTRFSTGYATGRTEPVNLFLRAKDRAAAKEAIRAKLIPGATFLR